VLTKIKDFLQHFFLQKKRITRDKRLRLAGSVQIFLPLRSKKTSFIPDVKLNRIFTLETKKSWGQCFAHIAFFYEKESNNL
jgi:hypothetical protein